MQQYYQYFDPPALNNWLRLLARMWLAEFNVTYPSGRGHIQHWKAFEETTAMSCGDQLEEPREKTTATSCGEASHCVFLAAQEVRKPRRPRRAKFPLTRSWPGPDSADLPSTLRSRWAKGPPRRAYSAPARVLQRGMPGAGYDIFRMCVRGRLGWFGTGWGWTQSGTTPQEPGVSSASDPLPSIGSRTHGTAGGCRPCMHHWKAGGCYAGRLCGMCHLCPKGSHAAWRKKNRAVPRRLKQVTHRRRQPERAAFKALLLEEASVSEGASSARTRSHSRPRSDEPGASSARARSHSRPRSDEPGASSARAQAKRAVFRTLAELTQSFQSKRLSISRSTEKGK